MSMRVCLETGCPALIPRHAPDGRCTTHRRTMNQRGYGAAHWRLRAAYQRRMNAGEAFTCWRCGAEIDPNRWHLGHDDVDRASYAGPECIPCNTATAGRRGGG